MINSKMIFRILGFLLLIETAMLLCCGAVSLFYKENDLQSFLISSAVTACIGFLLLAIGKDAVKSLNRRDGYVIVSAAWVTFSLFGMLPYYIGGYIPNVADAFFETMSGFSSTGATILNNIESMPHGILFWRAMTQWIGGLYSSPLPFCRFSVWAEFRCSQQKPVDLLMIKCILALASLLNGFGVFMPE